MTDVARFWLTDVGVDGFRLDAIKHLIEDGQDAGAHAGDARLARRPSARRSRRDAPNALLVGEVYDLSVAVARYVPGGRRPGVRLRPGAGDDRRRSAAATPQRWTRALSEDDGALPARTSGGRS